MSNRKVPAAAESLPIISRRRVHRTLATGSAVGALAGKIAIMATPAAATPAPHHPDAELIRLGHELEAFWKAENAVYERLKGDTSDEATAQTTAANRLTFDVVDQIEALSASTLEGVLVKVLAVSWCHCGDALEDDMFSDQNTTDVRLVSAILRDLSAMREAAR
jgi:hypothetical protein